LLPINEFSSFHDNNWTKSKGKPCPSLWQVVDIIGIQKKATIYGPTQYGDAIFQHLYVKQGNQRKAMSIIKARCGYNTRHTIKAIIYGPTQYGDANFQHLHVKQGIQQVMYYICHWRQQTRMISTALKCALSWAQFSSDMEDPILENTYVKLPHLEAKWIASMIMFLSIVDASIVLDNPSIPPLQRYGDSYIMEHKIHLRRISGSKIKQLWSRTY
jgi:hypothetical protein